MQSMADSLPSELMASRPMTGDEHDFLCALTRYYSHLVH